MAFSLTKWYLDVVTEDGGVAIPLPFSQSAGSNDTAEKR